MSYQKTIDYLYSLQKHGIKFGLSNSAVLMQLLDTPYRRFRSLHIAGTNGKGSTAAYLASIFRAAGYRTGLYTSPHLVSFTERIRIDNVPIPEERVVELAQRLQRCSEGTLSSDGAGPFSPTFFEVTTAMAFAYFAEESIDIAVVETGMGGRLDSTNVITPLVSVITNIDLEHTEFLGTTLEQIASEKAGIIKPGVPVVTGAVQPEAIAVIERTAVQQGAPLYRMPKDFCVERMEPGGGGDFDYRGIATNYQGLTISLLGKHQASNAALAVAAVECVARSGMAVSEPALRAGLVSASWEGRLERVAGRPDILLDGAHNPASAAVLAEALRSLRPSYRRLVLVMGILRDKDHGRIIDHLVPLADWVVATKPQYERAIDPQTLAADIRRRHGNVSIADTVEQAVTLARKGSSPNDLIIVTGSLYTVGDARAVLVQSAGGGAFRVLKG
jgi:dihydrofolate synthase/folylpolyglutamate synthase